MSDDTAKPGVSINLAVAGAHLRGQPLNHQLTDRSARFLESTTTAPGYRMYALGTIPPKPGLVRTPGEGRAQAVEVWELAAADFGIFVAGLPSPMAIGTVELADGREVPGFLLEPFAVSGAEDITEYGGWVSYLSGADQNSSTSP